MRISLEAAAEKLTSGQVVAIPTETVYGLAASLSHPEAISAVYALKGRPTANPLIVHVDCLHMPGPAQPLIDQFWPGPMTLVLPLITNIPSIARAGLPTAAYRIPAHPLTLELIKRTGPLVMPSANLSGRPSSTTADHVEADFGRDFPILDGGKTGYGLESTVLRFSQERWEIIRLGALPPTAFASVLGYLPAIVAIKPGEPPACPGQLYRHYAPRTPLFPFSENAEGAVVGFSDRAYPNCTLFSLGSSHSPEKVAEKLYATLRHLDDFNLSHAFVDMRLPQEGLWFTIAERLNRAITTPQIAKREIF